MYLDRTIIAMNWYISPYIRGSRPLWWSLMFSANTPFVSLRHLGALAGFSENCDHSPLMLPPICTWKLNTLGMHRRSSSRTVRTAFLLLLVYVTSEPPTREEKGFGKDEIDIKTVNLSAWILLALDFPRYIVGLTGTHSLVAFSQWGQPWPGVSTHQSKWYAPLYFIHYEASWSLWANLWSHLRSPSMIPFLYHYPIYVHSPNYRNGAHARRPIRKDSLSPRCWSEVQSTHWNEEDYRVSR